MTELEDSGIPEEIGSSVVARIGRLTEKAKRIAADRNRLAAELGESKGQADQLRRDVDSLRTKLIEYEARDEGFSSVQGALESEVADIKSQFQESEQKRDSLSNHREQLQTELGTLKKELVDITEQKDVSANELDVSRKIGETLRGERDSLNARLRNAESELDTLKRDYQSTKSKLAETKFDLDHVRDELGAFPPALREKLQNDLDRSQERTSGLEEDLKKCTKQLSANEFTLEERDLELQRLRRHISGALS